jgi:uncharacterized DUF497 family protein
MALSYEWDPRKAASNLSKHGISFAEASTVFDDPLALTFPDEDHSEREQRELIIGHSIAQNLLLVCFTEREADRVRIFSARMVTRQEQKDYEENVSP